MVMIDLLWDTQNDESCLNICIMRTSVCTHFKSSRQEFIYVIGLSERLTFLMKKMLGQTGREGGSWHLWLDRTNVSLSETITRHTLGCFRRRPSMFLFCFGLFGFCLCMCVDFLRTVWLVSPVLTSRRKKGKTTYQSPKAHTDTLMYQQNQIIVDRCYIQCNMSEIHIQRQSILYKSC